MKTHRWNSFATRKRLEHEKLYSLEIDNVAYYSFTHSLMDTFIKNKSQILLRNKHKNHINAFQISNYYFAVLQNS